jgi:PTH1 family peptidyl-tRNA hydrolase
LWLVAGLGNPGRRYARTRHNVGFLVLEDFLEKNGLEFTEKKNYRLCKGSIDGIELIIMEPLTFMNLSGEAVKKMIDKLAIPPERIIVIHDDLDMDVGRVKIRRRGSSGGHRGIESIIESIASKEFMRIKVGIGRDYSIPSEKYVLSKFKRNEIPLVRDAIKMASDALYSIITEGIERTMNMFN